MAKYKLSFWEENEYHDSYFYVAAWDDEKKTVVKESAGATAYAGPIGPTTELLPPTLEIVEQAVAWLAKHIYNVNKRADNSNVMAPEPRQIYKGTMVRLLVDGVWNNSKEGAKVEYKANDCGTVFWIGSYGTFYRNGYNKPNRKNTSVGIKLASGASLFIPLSKVRLDRELQNDAELVLSAAEAAKECQFRTIWFGGWDSDNYALAVLKSKPVHSFSKE